MIGARGPNVCTVAPGAPFLKTFARALVNGEVIAGFPDAHDPMSLAGATLYVPTRRAARALALEIARLSPARAQILPRIIPLGVMEGVENDLLFDVANPDPAIMRPFSADLPEAISELRRRLILTQLILKWSNALRGALTSVGPDGRLVENEDEPALVASSPAQAFHLAGDLAALMDEMIVEGVDWDRMRTLAPENLAKYWDITLTFLKIATSWWPEHLQSLGLVEQSRRQVELVGRRVEQIRAGGSGVEIVAGSTGANVSTARLIAAIARSPNGAVALPGLDIRMDDAAWSAIAGEGSDPAATHAQAAFRRLLPLIGIDRADVRELGEGDPAIAARLAFVREAMRPAETTHAWTGWRAARGPAQIGEALSGLEIIEAADEREEALAIAIALRSAIETPELTAALITPDRTLARRVRAELQRWNIELDDSGGDPLSGAPLGVLARLALDCAQPSCASAPILALLRHPLTRLGLRADEIGRRVSDAEIGVLRGGRPDMNDPAPAVAAARARVETDPHAHRAVASITEDDWEALGDLLVRLRDALAPLRALAAGPRPQTSDWVKAHVSAVEAIIAVAAGEESRGIEDLGVLRELLAGLGDAGIIEGGLAAQDYAVFFDTAARDTAVRRQRAHHPRIKSLGLLEARLMTADLVIVAGLDETVWPPAARTDAFLSRPMRAELGLSAPERRIGQTAHDFMQAIGAPRVMLTRALKRGGSPTTPSRFLQRIRALAGEAWDTRRDAGGGWLALARALDTRPGEAPVRRPEPTPAVELRPVRLSVTRIETLRRDPYSIYAEHVLKLRPLDGLDEDEGAAGFGTRMHAALAAFQTQPADVDARDLLDIARDAFADQFGDPEFVAFQWPRVQAICAAFLQWQENRREDVDALLIEQKGALDIQLPDGSTFTLSAEADRIERRADGSYVAIDFKTGNPPSAKTVAVGFAPQLTLEAEMIARGAFPGVAAGAQVSDILYVKLGGPDGLAEKTALEKNTTAADLGREHYEGLVKLLAQFRNRATPYVPRPYPQFEAAYNRYDHLSRYREWSAGGGDGA